MIEQRSKLIEIESPAKGVPPELVKISLEVKNGKNVSSIRIGISFNKEKVIIFRVPNIGYFREFLFLNKTYSDYESFSGILPEKPNPRQMYEHFLTTSEAVNDEKHLNVLFRIYAQMRILKGRSPDVNMWDFYHITNIYDDSSLAYKLQEEELEINRRIDFYRMEAERLERERILEQSRKASQAKKAQPVKKPYTKTEQGPIKPVFSTMVFSHNTKMTTDIPPLMEMHLNLDVKKETSLLLEKIAEKIKVDPYMKIICDSDGNLSLRRVSSVDEIETYLYTYCPYHTGANFSTMGPVSSDLSKRHNGLYGYMTKYGKCYDCCGNLSVSPYSTEEEVEIKKNQEIIIRVLDDILRMMDKFKKMIDDQEKNNNTLSLKKFELYSKTSDYTNHFGSEADKNIQLIGTEIKPIHIFNKRKMKVRDGRKMVDEFKFDNLQIIKPLMMSSFFNNQYQVLKFLDQADLNAKIHGVSITLPKDISTKLITLLDQDETQDFRETNLEKTCYIHESDSGLFCRIEEYSLSFEIQGSQAAELKDLLDFEYEDGQRYSSESLILTPVYPVNSYRHSVFNLGKAYAISNGFYDEIKDNHSVILFLGMCYISSYSDDVFNFLDSKISEMNFCLVESDANIYTIFSKNLTMMINELENALIESGEKVEIHLDEETYLTLIKDDVISLIQDIKVHLEDTIFFKKLEIKRDDVPDLIETITEQLGSDTVSFEYGEEKVNLSNLEATELFKKLSIYSNPDLTVTFRRIPLIEENFDYIGNQIDELSNIEDRKHFLTVALFDDIFEKIQIKGKIINMREELRAFNPFHPKNMLNPSISKNDARGATSLRKYMEYFEKIDKIAFQAYDRCISQFGNEVIKSVFLEDLKFDEKEKTIKLASMVYEKRRELKSIYQQYIKNVILDAREIEQSYYELLGNYPIYAVEYYPSSFNVIPTTPMIVDEQIKEDMEIRAVLGKFVDEDEALTSIKPRIKDRVFATMFDVLFKNLTQVNLSYLIPNYFFISDGGVKYCNELSKIDLILKFVDTKYDLNMGDNEAQFNTMVSDLQSSFNGVIKHFDFKKGINEFINSYKVSNMSFETLVETIVGNFRRMISQFSWKTNRDVTPVEVFDRMISSFSKLLGSFINIRKKMASYISSLAMSLYDIRDKNNLDASIKHDTKHDLQFLSDIQLIKKRDQLNPDDKLIAQIDRSLFLRNSYRVRSTFQSSKDIYQEAQNACSLIIDRLDQSIQDSGGSIKLTIDQSKKIYDKFSPMILSCQDQLEFNSMIRAFNYYLASNLDQSYYLKYVEHSDNYSNAFKQGNESTLSIFKENQDKVYIELSNLYQLREEKNKAASEVESITLKIKDLGNKIDSMKSELTSNFVEFVSVIDVIYNTYKDIKKSYGSSNEFYELIQDIKVRSNKIYENYQGLDNPEIKMVLSIFSFNSDIYKLRTKLFQRFKFEVRDDFYQAINDGMKYIRDFAMLDERTQDNFLLTRIPKLPNEEVNFKTKAINFKRGDKLNFAKVIYAHEFFELFREKQADIEDKFFTLKFNGVSIPSREDKVRFPGYGDELNSGFDEKIDHFTLQKVQIISGNISKLLDLIDSALKVIDSGPGLHFLSDSIEHFMCVVKDFDPEDRYQSYLKFKESMKKFINYNSFFGKNIDNIVNSSEFKTFVSILNGEFEELSSITETINFYHELPNVYTVYSQVTPTFVKGVLLTFEALANDSKLYENEFIINLLSANCGVNSFEVDELVNKFVQFNNACINFLDEYKDNDGRVLTDLQVIQYKPTHILKVSSDFMIPLFKKLNKCLKIFIEEEKSSFKSNLVTRFINYNDVFNSKFMALKSLESHIITKFTGI